MKNYYCEKCGSVDFFIDERGHQKALMCDSCGRWIKWISKSELPFIKKFINADTMTVLKISKLFNTEELILLKKCKDETKKKEALYIDEIEMSKYAGSEVIEIIANRNGGLMNVNLGDKVQSKITGAVGEVVEISEDRDIKVLEDNGFTSVFSSDNALIKINEHIEM